MIRHIWLDRPEKRNALRVTDMERLRGEIDHAGADRQVTSIVIAGRGPSFCAGVDINEFATATEVSATTLIAALGALCAAARTAPKPVAAAIQGHCVGGALELALCCDLRVCSEDASFSMPEVAIGIPSVIDAALIERYIGIGRARELILTGDPMEAAEAHARGLVNRVVPADRLLEETEALAGRAARHDAAAIAAQKRLFQEWLDLPYSTGLKSSSAALARSFRNGTPQRLAKKALAR